MPSRCPSQPTSQEGLEQEAPHSPPVAFSPLLSLFFSQFARARRGGKIPGPSSAGLREKHTVINVIKCPCRFCDWLESRTLRTAPLPERTRVPAELQTVGLARVGEGRRSAASEVASVPARSVPRGAHAEVGRRVREPAPKGP